MSTEELKEYLGIVVDMEKSIYLQKSLIETIEQQIRELNVPKIFEDLPEPVKPICFETPAHKSLYFLSSMIYFVIAFVVAIIPTGIILNMIPGRRDLKTENALLIIFALIIAITYTAYQIFKTIASEKAANEEILTKYNQRMKRYQIQMKKWQENIDQNQHKRQQDEAERQTKTMFLTYQRKEIIKSLAESKECLQKIYAKNIIFPKYRNLIMVCSLYEYICAGRCTELEGHEGAYNILETEIRLDRIISQLDLVVANLEQIKHNQFMLYSAMQESNQRFSQITEAIRDMSASLDGIYSSTSQLNKNAAQLNAHIAELQKTSVLAAYHAERAQKELAYMNRMDYLAGRNDDVFFNHPPV